MRMTESRDESLPSRADVLSVPACQTETACCTHTHTHTHTQVTKLNNNIHTHSGGVRLSGSPGHRSFWRPPLPLEVGALEVGPLKPS